MENPVNAALFAIDPSKMTSIDPITIAVIQAGMTAAADEMFSTLRRTAMSPIIHEVLDVGTGVMDGDGRLASSGAGIPSFIGVLDKAVKRILEIEGENSIRDGDVFITNDPYRGGVTHLSDIVVAQPVFVNSQRIAWTASIAHWSDIGGITPGSMSTKATEIFQEGLRLPAVRLFDQGRRVSSIFDIIAANSRLPDFSTGDLWAQIAAGRRAARRISELSTTYGDEAYSLALTALFDEGERRALDGLRRLPGGVYEITEEQDDGSHWNARITITEQEFLVDLRQNPMQRNRPYNTSRDGSVISAQMIFKALVDPELYANEGSFRPLRVLTETGTIFHSTDPAPHGYYFETRIRLYDMLWRCIAEALPDLLPAGHFGSICGTVIAGDHPDTGRRFTMVEPQMGGWGATSERGGLDAMFSSSHGDTYNCPIEILESRYGIDVGWKRLNADESGAGLHNGGKGLSMSYQPRSRTILAAGFSRNRINVWGLNGGSDGGTNQIRVVRPNGQEEKYSFVSDLIIEPGDEIIIETANGGGWGRQTSPAHTPND